MFGSRSSVHRFLSRIRSLLMLPLVATIASSRSLADTFSYEDTFETDAVILDSRRRAPFLDDTGGIRLHAALHYEAGSFGRGLGFYSGFHNGAAAFLAYRALPSETLTTGGSVQFFILPNRDGSAEMEVWGSGDETTWSLWGAVDGVSSGLVSIPVPERSPAQFIELRGNAVIDDLQITVHYARTDSEFVLGINYPWVKYGLDFGNSGFGHVGLSSDCSEGFRPQTFIDSQGIRRCERSQERVYAGSYSLKAYTALLGGDRNLSSGEVLVDLQDIQSVPNDFALDLTGETLTAWVYVPPGNRGDSSRPNFLQLLVKDASSGAPGLYGGQRNIPNDGGWVELSMTVRAAGQFDPSRVRFVGVKIGIGTGSSAGICDPIFIDAVKAGKTIVDFGFERRSLAAIDMEQIGTSCANTVRWFVFADGRASPEFDGQGFVTGLDHKFYDDFDELLRLADLYDFRVIPVLFDFLLCANRVSCNKVALFGHADLMRDPIRTQSFLNFALEPLLRRYGPNPRILYWEIMNEPEWCHLGLTFPPGTCQPPRLLPGTVTVPETQTFVRSIANRIHGHPMVASKLVTLGSASDQFLDLWEDVGVDVCQFHFYNCDDCIDAGRTFDFPSDCLLGEFAASESHTDLSVSGYLQRACAYGYRGALPWSWRGRDVASPAGPQEKQSVLGAFTASCAAVRACRIALLKRCLSGPGIAFGIGCQRADSDKDADIDLEDFRDLQLSLGQ